MKYIKINEELEFLGGFLSSESILVLNYLTNTVNKKVNEDGSMDKIDDFIRVEVRLFKDIQAYSEGKSDIHPIDWLGISTQYHIDESVGRDFNEIIQYISNQLTDQGVSNELLERN